MLDLDIIAASLRLATPLLLAALGGLYCERAGIVNIGLEGIMLFGAAAAAIVAFYTQSAVIGLLAAVIVGLCVAGIHGFVTITNNGNQIISGVGINILGLAVPSVLCGALFDTPNSSPPLEFSLPQLSIPGLSALPVLGPVFFSHSWMVYAALLLVPVTWFLFYRTVFGLHMRAVGENPRAAEAVGVSVRRFRWYGVLISGVLAGLAGAFLSIDHGSQFINNMTAGRGFIALAALIFGRWHPIGVLGACLLFGCADAMQIRLQGAGWLAPQLVQIFPYLLTILLLAGIGGRTRPPAASGLAYHRD